MLGTFSGISVLSSQAAALAKDNRPAESAACWREVVQLTRHNPGFFRERYTALSNFADELTKIDQKDEAIDIWREFIGLSRELGPDKRVPLAVALRHKFAISRSRFRTPASRV